MPVVGDYLVIKAGNAGLVLAYKRGFKDTLTVSWGGYFKLACVATDGLFSVTVTIVWLDGFLMLGVAQMVFYLSLKSGVDKGLHEVLLKVFDVLKAVHATSHLFG